MKHNLFRSKRFFLIVSITLIMALGIGAIVVWNNNRLPKIFAYVPAAVDQVMVNRPYKNIGMSASALAGIPEGVQAQFQQIEAMIIAQRADLSGQQMLFLEARNGFSPEDFLKTLNPETEIMYTYLRLDTNRYLFAPQKVIQLYKKPQNNKGFFDQQELAEYPNLIKNSSLTMISHSSEIIRSQEQYASLLQKVQYFIVAIDSTKQQTNFKAYLLFSTPQNFSLPKFTPQFTSYLKASTIAYLELGDIMTTLGINADQLFGEGSGENASAAIAKNQFISKLFENHVGLIVSKGNNMTNLGITLISKNKDLYNTLAPLVPTLQPWLQSLPILSGASLVAVTQPGKIGYDITIQGTAKFGLYVEQGDDETKISLGNPIIDGSSNKKLLVQSNSLAILKIDLNQLIGLYKQAANIGMIDPSFISQQDFFSQMENKTFYGNFALDPKRAILEGQIK